MPLIPPVSPVDALGKSAVDMTKKHITPEVSPELSQKFGELMKSSKSESAGESNLLDKVSHAVKAQQEEFQAMQNNMVNVLEHHHSLSPAGHFEAFAKLTMDASIAHMKISLSSGMTKSSNKSLQTLLKNE